jgi:hypothetical protein
MARTLTESLGMIEALLAYMQNPENKEALTAKEFDAAPHLTRLTKKSGGLSKLNSEQEKLKVTLTRKTEELNTALSDAYTDASGTIDAMMGMLGKNTPEAKNLQKIRSAIRRNGGSAGAAPEPPAAPAP